LLYSFVYNLYLYKRKQMKTLVKLGLIAALGSSLFLTSCAGDYYVSDQPAVVV
jgi:hypothetical protein